ncbi:hypothetical protein BASA81_000242 [Batrachochytrium salamandrivorans]|nr:hypothetical protein BASA81_000242 [Batrachochytrium salamandrivorans]
MAAYRQDIDTRIGNLEVVCSDLREECNGLQDVCSGLQEECSVLQEDNRSLKVALSKYKTRVKALESKLERHAANSKPVAIRTNPTLPKPATVAAAAAVTVAEISTPTSFPKFKLHSKVKINSKVMSPIGDCGKIIEICENKYKLQSLLDNNTMMLKEDQIICLMPSASEENKRQRRSSTI